MIAPVVLPKDPFVAAEMRFLAVKVNFERTKQRFPVWSYFFGIFQRFRRFPKDVEEEIELCLTSLNQLEEERPVIREFLSSGTDQTNCLLNRIGNLRRVINEYRQRFRPSKA